MDAALRFIEQEAKAMLTRLSRLQPFALQEAMVPAAMFSQDAQVAIEIHMSGAKEKVHQAINEFLAWIKRWRVGEGAADVAQKKFTLLRLKFNAVLAQLDIFSDALTQRSEHSTGVWLAGLDVLAADALALPGYYKTPPVVCYLDRGAGAAIRRARTRLPGGGENPVAIIRVPRERMIGSGIASSLVHEVGHQAAALLGLVESLRPVLQARAGEIDATGKVNAWDYWAPCISEILADFWSVARLGVVSTLGLIGVVSLPRAFVFRINMDDPHPFPWIRVKVSCALGNALYPHAQWAKTAAMWESLYPKAGLTAEQLATINVLESSINELAETIASHRPKSLEGKSLGAVLTKRDRSTATLEKFYQQWENRVDSVRTAPPTLVFASLGLARAGGKLSPAEESKAFASLLSGWAATRQFPKVRS
jgi:hypothetical protein